MEDASLFFSVRARPQASPLMLVSGRSPWAQLSHRRRALGCLQEFFVWLTMVSALTVTTGVAEALQIKLAPDAAPEIVFDSAHDSCQGGDPVDLNARAYRDANGHVVMFALYDTNRTLRGKDLAHLSIDCHVTLASRFDPKPAHYDDRNFLTATWTTDGRNITALIHHEYHADAHGRCSAHTDLACWYNTVLAYHSKNGGEDFVRSQPLVVAAAPFRQNAGQGRHRGFFNPSNIFSDGTYEYFFAATTGWDGQPFGACLFRSATPEKSGSWRAFDGHAFTIRYDDPYAAGFVQPKTCRPISPFVFPVGAVVRARANGSWIAVFQATRNAEVFPVDGFYYATATDLEHWSMPRLLLAGKTLFSDLCTAGPSVIAYPSLIDATASGRNFDNVGTAPFLYYARIAVSNCATGARQLVRQQLAIDLDPQP